MKRAPLQAREAALPHPGSGAAAPADGVPPALGTDSPAGAATAPGLVATASAHTASAARGRRLGGWASGYGFGLAVFALGSLWKTALGHYGIALALLAGLPRLIAATRQAWDTTAALAAITAAWLLARWGLQNLGYADPGLIDTREVLIDWVFPLLFLPLAALPIGGRIARLRCLWLLALLGCTLGVLGFLYTNGPALLWSQERLGYHLNRPLGIGLYAGCFVVVLAATWRQWWRAGGRWRWAVRAGGIAGLALYLQVLITAQNRSTYLALVLVGGAALVTTLWRVAHAGTGSTPGSPRWRRLALAGLVLATMATALVSLNARSIGQRLVEELDVVAAIERNGLSAAPASSISARLHMWHYVKDRFGEAPWIGHGFGSLKAVIERDLQPQVEFPSGEGYDHVHNSYLQLLWSQGILGTLLWTALILALLRDVLRTARHNPEVRTLLPAMWGVLAFTAVWASFDYRLSHPDMRFFTVLLLMSLRLLGQAGPLAIAASGTGEREGR